MYTEQELRQLAEQLSAPHGDAGLEVAGMMNDTNTGMTLSCIQALDLKDGDRVLEAGHGNCAHLPLLFKEAGVHYTGLEISALMHSEAKRLNAAAITSGRAAFHVYDGLRLPFDDQTFDKVLTVNTIYFWKQPQVFITELFRVMKPGAVCCIGLAWKHFMETLPFTRFGFTLYDEQMIRDLVKPAGFLPAEIFNHRETIMSKAGTEAEREYAVVRLRK